MRHQQIIAVLSAVSSLELPEGEWAAISADVEDLRRAIEAEEDERGEAALGRLKAVVTGGPSRGGGLVGLPPSPIAAPAELNTLVLSLIREVENKRGS